LKSFFFIQFLLALYIFIEYEESYKLDDLVGSWEGKLNGRDIVLEFEKNMDFRMKMINKTKDDSNVSKGIYNVNFLKNPIPLSIYNIDNLSHPLHTIIKFNDLNSITLARISLREKLRRVNFDKSTNIHFKRIKH